MVQVRPRYGVVRDASGQWVRAVTGEEYYSTVTQRTYTSRARAEYAERMSERYYREHQPIAETFVWDYDNYPPELKSPPMFPHDVPGGNTYYDANMWDECESADLDASNRWWKYANGRSYYAVGDASYVAVIMAQYHQLTLIEDDAGNYDFFSSISAENPERLEWMGTILVFKGVKQ